MVALLLFPFLDCVGGLGNIVSPFLSCSRVHNPPPKNNKLPQTNVPSPRVFPRHWPPPSDCFHLPGSQFYSPLVSCKNFSDVLIILTLPPPVSFCRGKSLKIPLLQGLKLLFCCATATLVKRFFLPPPFCWGSHPWPACGVLPLCCPPHSR